MAETTLGVAEAKRRFSELIDRIERGERFVVNRRGKPVVVLSAPGTALPRPRTRPLGLAAFAGALAEWRDLEHVVKDIHAARRKARDRDVPELE